MESIRHFALKRRIKHIAMETIELVMITVLIITLIIALYQKSTNAMCKSKKRLDGKTVIVTGGTTGMGLEIATDLADRGARVIIACPFKNEGDEALKIIKQKTESEQVVFKLLDLSSIDSVRKFATDILKNEDRLDILANNAGVAGGEESITDNGMSFIMQVNYFGHVLLTLLLMPLLKKTGTPLDPARVINTSSCFHYFGTVDFDKLNNITYYFSFRFYANSKLCLVLFSHEITKKLISDNVVVNCVDPGAVGTTIFYGNGLIVGYIISRLVYIIFKTPLEGAQTALHAALDKKAGTISGGFFKNCELSSAKQSAYNDVTAKRLWDESMRLLKLSKQEIEECLK